MVEKGIRGGTCNAIDRYVEANNKGKNKESSNIKYWNVDTLYRWEAPQKLPVNGFKRVENKSQFTEDFIKSYNEESD